MATVHEASPVFGPELVAAHNDSASDADYVDAAEHSGDGGTLALADASLQRSAQDTMAKVLCKHLKSRGLPWATVRRRTGPLNLLELPVDVLRLIAKEITHTNDLTALALTNSALYSLAVPLIYARFDIVWPDQNMPVSDFKSVDALTYGLSTLTLGSRFARTTRALLYPDADSAPFRSNDYAKYTRKFSLGNGPDDWVAEYNISKESGKMLGTLVAMAVARMANLETFVWDMPTGVISDVFMALSPLGAQAAGECKLDRVWVRWHDNSENNPTSAAMSSGTQGGPPPHSAVPVGSTMTPVGILLPADVRHPTPRSAIPYSQHRVEYPTFSVLPPLKSLTVLEIDELAYLDEMATLIERSKNSLHELRVGISAKAAHKDFSRPWDGAGLKQVDHKARWPGESTVGERRLGGVLGVLVGRIYDIRRKRPKQKTDASATAAPPKEDAGAITSSSAAGAKAQDAAVGNAAPANAPSTTHKALPRKRLEGKLRLDTLELERVLLSMQVCRYAIDWSVLTKLTLIECGQHELLWRMLRKHFGPASQGPVQANSFSKSGPGNATSGSIGPAQLPLALKHLHTDLVSEALVLFIKETLAPNTLEVLFLQDRRRGNGAPAVTADYIFRGAIFPHRKSLRKLLLDSSSRALPSSGGSATGGGADAGAGANGGGGPAANVSPDSTRWHHWAINTNMVLSITSGRIPNLRELAVAIDHRDWHLFLQRLPNTPQLHALHITHMGNHLAGHLEAKELALQICDIVTLRPEIQLCYVGVAGKCFEMLEAPGDPGVRLSGSGRNNASTGMASGTEHVSDDEAEDENDVEDDTSDEEGTGANGETDDEGQDQDGNTPTSQTDPDETQSEGGTEGLQDRHDDDYDSFFEPERTGLRLKLREILFYEDKVEIYKARHARL